MTKETLTLGKHFLTIDSTIPFTINNPVTQESITKTKGKWTIDCFKLLPEKYFKNNPQFVLELVYDETIMSSDDRVVWTVTDIDIGSIQSENENVQIVNSDSLDVEVTNIPTKPLPITNGKNNSSDIPLKVVDTISGNVLMNFNFTSVGSLNDNMGGNTIKAGSYIFIRLKKSNNYVRLCIQFLTDTKCSGSSSGEVLFYGQFKIVVQKTGNCKVIENVHYFAIDSNSVDAEYISGTTDNQMEESYDTIEEFVCVGTYF